MEYYTSKICTALPVEDVSICCVYLQQPRQNRVSVWNKLALVLGGSLFSQGRDHQTKCSERPGKNTTDTGNLTCFSLVYVAVI